MFEPGLDFLAAFFGALFAGVIAVPVFPPLPPRFAGFDHLERVQRDAGAEAILTSSALSELADSVPGGRERLRNVRWIVTDRDGDAEAWRDPGVTSSTRLNSSRSTGLTDCLVRSMRTYSRTPARRRTRNAGSLMSSSADGGA